MPMSSQCRIAMPQPQVAQTTHEYKCLCICSDCIRARKCPGDVQKNAREPQEPARGHGGPQRPHHRSPSDHSRAHLGTKGHFQRSIRSPQRRRRSRQKTLCISKGKPRPPKGRTERLKTTQRQQLNQTNLTACGDISSCPLSSRSHL